MQAIILAAGMGKRLKDLTKNNTKCMVKVNGITLIERMLHQIEKHSISRVIIVVGYESEKLIDYIESLNIQIPIYYILNDVFDKTNNIYSLALAKERLCEEDTLLFESDLIFEDSVLNELIYDQRDTLALVDKYESWMDGTCVKIGQEDCIEAFIPGNRFKYEDIKEYYKTVNIYKFSKHFSETYYVPFLEAYQSALGENEYYEQVLRVITMLDEPVIKAKKLNGQRWYEIDDIQDLDIAESIFSPDENERVKRLQERFGGYWRYPKLLDFSYLVNPYYPPQKMKDEIQANFNALLTGYPSGMHVNSLLAAKNFGVRQENIIVGNGAAELIKCLMEKLDGITGFIRPTFDEYPNRYKKESSICFTPENRDYAYSCSDVVSFFEDKPIRNLIIINPDNPSGNYIQKEQLIGLVEWCKNKNIRLIVDESFADFSDEDDPTLINQEILALNPHLYVMKSISKSYGVPGIRLGVLASGNETVISELKKDVAIWNINSFGEFFMQIEEKYQKSYMEGLRKLKIERARFQKELSMINGVRVIPSQANYVMLELDKQIPSGTLLKELLIHHNILIKDLMEKLHGGNYLRLAIRNTEDNNKLLEALKNEINRIMHTD